MEDEVYVEEDIINTDSEIVNDVELDNSIEETESADSYTTDDVVSALLQLLNEQGVADEVEGSEEQSSSDSNESAPLLVSVENDIDYSSQIEELNLKLDNIYTLLEEQSIPKSLDTPLNEYNLDSILLLGVLVVLLLSLGYKFIKDNLLHL